MKNINNYIQRGNIRKVLGKLRHIKIDKVLDAIGFPKNYKNLLRMDY